MIGCGLVLFPDLPRSELVNKLHSVLDFAFGAIPLLTADDRQAGAAPSFKREKFVCETALLLYAASGVGDDAEIRDHILAVAQRLESHARSDSVVSLMHLRPSHASEVAVAHICLTCLGLPDEAFHDELTAVTSAVGCRSSERTPWKEFEAAWGEEKSGLRFGAAPEGALGKTLFARGPDSILARREDLYAFTHALFYLTDFGNRSPRLPRHLAAVVDDAESAVARCLDEDDFDLCSELLLTWPYLKAPWSSTAAFALSVMMRVESEVGILPSMTLREPDAELSDRDARMRYFFTEAYHTVYVFGLLMAALLRVPPSSHETHPMHGQRYMELLELLPERQTLPQWLMDFNTLPQHSQAALEPFLATVAVRRAIMGNDFAALHRILRVAFDHNLPVTPPLAQAADLLSRLSQSRSLCSAQTL